MDKRLYFEDLQIGDRWCSHSRTITEADIGRFADLTGDHDPLHVDQEYAKRSPFGRPIAHGLLGLSFLAGLSSNCPAVNTAAFLAIRDWQFVRPAYVGDTVHAVTQVVDLQPSSRRHGRVVWVRELVNHKDEVVQRGVFETLVSTLAGSRSRGSEAAVPARTAIHGLHLQGITPDIR